MERKQAEERGGEHPRKGEENRGDKEEQIVTESDNSR